MNLFQILWNLYALDFLKHFHAFLRLRSFCCLCAETSDKIFKFFDFRLLKLVIRHKLVKFGTAHFFCEKGGDTVRRIAVCGGSAGDLVADAISLGADTMICGEMRYHSAIDAADSGLSVVCVGHYESEAPALMRLSELVREAGAEEIVIYEVKQYAV